MKMQNETFGEAFHLQFITHCTEQYDYVTSARLALEGGCRWIQLRMKEQPTDAIREAAWQIEPLCRRYGAMFLLDDRVELVQELHADGVHLGKHDMPISEARYLLGEEYIIGGTANTYEDVYSHYQQGATYIGCGPFRFTTTKKNLNPVLGLEGYRMILSRMQAEGVSLPVVAIGGITAADIPDILSTGVDGIALSGTILHASDPVAETQRILQLTQL